MENPNTETTTQQTSSNENDKDNVIHVESLQRNQEDCQQTLELFLSCVRNPKQKLGQKVTLKEDDKFAKNMRILENIGYQRNAEKQCFELQEKPTTCPFKHTPGPRVQLKDDDKEYIIKMNWLEQNGYARNKDDDSFELSEEATQALNQQFKEKLEAVSMRKKSEAKAQRLAKATKSTIGLSGVLIGIASSVLFRAMVP